MLLNICIIKSRKVIFDLVFELVVKRLTGKDNDYLRSSIINQNLVLDLE